MKKIMTLALMAFLGFSVKAQDQTDLFLDSVMQAQHIPGIAVAVIREGEIIKKQTYGLANLEWNIPLRESSPFQLASVTKIYTGMLLGKMHQEGLLSLDDPMGSYLDSIPDSWKGITIRQLAAHQSGIRMISLESYQDLGSAMKAAVEAGLEYEPGSREFYVSTDYAFLNQIIQNITGMPFQEAMDKHLLKPLGLTQTGFDNLSDGGLFRSANLIKERVAVYGWDTDHHFISDMRFPIWFYPAGGIYSSISDMAKAMQALDSGVFIRKEIQDMVFGPNPLKDGKQSNFGLGWITEEYQGFKMTGHSGGPALADLIRFPDLKISIIVLTNRRGGFYPFLSRGVARFYIEGLVMPEIPD
ncbi:serine hydrolase domain-containing protein [Algoriphagus sp. CAU 1675]|uniref:serine hydrolase domain-containing protein n=1 Tax=Algoriphagus sp. CAU 1675 TaxID=3032597 RepID=UPI0023DC7227|nr:serine hydrolase domain-containing protein [Algoriphagus sp. CAU 1675]MDF2157046.1 serine hydrolase [Algoriphagus sp. CAU 1675]